jgi:hypothetical protein
MKQKILQDQTENLNSSSCDSISNGVFNVGFQTADGSVKEENLKIIKNTIFDEHDSVHKDNSYNFAMHFSNVCGGFKTAGGRAISIDQEKINLVKDKLFSAINDDHFPLKNSGGFQTAGGKSIKISDESIESIKRKIFDQIEPNLEFQTAKGSSILVKKDSFDQAKQNHNKSNSTESLSIPPIKNLLLQNQISTIKNDAFKIPSITAVNSNNKAPNFNMRARDNSKGYKRPQLVDKTKLNKYIDTDFNNTSIMNESINSLEKSENVSNLMDIDSQPTPPENNLLKNIHVFKNSINKFEKLNYLKMLHVNLETISWSSPETESSQQTFCLVKPSFQIVNTPLR